MTQREFVQAFAIRHNLDDVEDMYALAATIDALDPDRIPVDVTAPPSFDAEELEAAIKKGTVAWSEWPGEPDQWGVHPSGKTVAIPAKYHRLAINKRLSSSEKSAILFETSGQKHFFMYLGPSDDGRFIYDMPGVTHGDLKVLYTHIKPYPHFFARNFTLAPDAVYTPRFKTVDHRGRTVHEGEAV